MRNLVMGCAVAAMVALSVRTEARPPELKLLQVRQAPAYKAQVGVASWYGEECQGKYTASGEIFDMNALTCASRDLPLGTKVKITNLRNSRSLVLKVNDRGPTIASRLVDVSRHAAEKLGFAGAGLAPVTVEVLSYPRDPHKIAQVHPTMTQSQN